MSELKTTSKRTKLPQGKDNYSVISVSVVDNYHLITEVETETKREIRFRSSMMGTVSKLDSFTRELIYNLYGTINLHNSKCSW